MDTKDPFRDLTFDGRPGQYREFRRKVILSVAALEDKNQHLAGPKLLSRLSGEAWRCTEHLSIADVRSKRGWLTVLECLDKHYKHLPEVELHEAIDEFLFHLKKRNGEGTTGFAARFKTALSRLENLIQQEREAAKVKRRRKGDLDRLRPASPVASSLEESDSAADPPPSEGAAGPTDDTDEGAETETAKASQAAATGSATPKAAAAPGPERQTTPGRTEFSARSKAGSDGGSKKSSKKSTGTHTGDASRAQLEMQRMLGTLEPSHRKPKPIFPQSVLGHLFMRKFGLNREQRTLVIRSTGGSSRFLDVERILRASDLEDNRFEDRKLQKPQLRPQKQVYAVQDGSNDSSSLEAPLTESGSDEGEVLAGEHEQQSTDDELAEIYEVQKKAKKDFKKSFKSYKESKRRVKEIKKTRAGPSTYYPVVAMPPDSTSASGSQQTTVSMTARTSLRRRVMERDRNHRKGKKPI